MLALRCGPRPSWARIVGKVRSQCASGRGIAGGSPLGPASKREKLRTGAPASARVLPPRAGSSPAGSRLLKCAVVGSPNAGKSVLVNALAGAKVSAVSSKYNTTRTAVRGVLTHQSTQVVFTDTPGFVNTGDGRFIEPLVHTAREQVPLADLTMLVVDAARRPSEHDFSVIRRALQRNPRSVCVARAPTRILLARAQRSAALGLRMACLSGWC